MTSDDLRQLDAEVAVRVMGWRYCESLAGSYGCVLRKPEEVATFLPEFISETPVGHPLDVAVPRYSTDIAAAWAVVEAVVHGGAYIHDGKRNGATDCRLLFHPYERTWECKFSWSSGYAVEVSDSDAAVAVCRAALLCSAPEARP